MMGWHVVNCKPRQETVAQENLLRQGFCVYLPRLQLRQRRRGRWIDATEPLFPRYLFLQIDPQLRSTAPIRSTRGAVGLVRFGTHPAVMSDELIEALRDREDAASGMHIDASSCLRVGDAVKVVEGPLSGMEGIFSEQDGEQRVVVLLELLGKTNSVTVPNDWIAVAA